MPHTWVEVALNPKEVRSPNWYTRAPTTYGVDVTATQFDVKQYYASAPLAVWPAGEEKQKDETERECVNVYVCVTLNFARDDDDVSFFFIPSFENR